MINDIRELNDWTKKDLLGVLREYRNQNPDSRLAESHTLSRLSNHNLRKYTLKLVSCQGGKDLYGLDPEKIEKLDGQAQQIILERQKETKERRRNERKRYLVSYVIVSGLSYETVEEEVEVRESQFTGKDGRQHYLNERCLKIIERII